MRSDTASSDHPGLPWGQMRPISPVCTEERFGSGTWGGAKRSAPVGGRA